MQRSEGAVRILCHRGLRRLASQLASDRTVEGIGANFENRGILRSGEFLRRRAEGLRDSNRQFGAIELDTAGRYAGIENSLASQLAQYQLQNSDQLFGVEGRAASRAGSDYDFARRKAFLEAG